MKPEAKFFSIYATVSGVLTACALYVVNMDDSWASLWVAIILAPIAFVILLFGGLCAANMLCRRCSGVLFTSLLPIVLAFPIVGILCVLMVTQD